VLEPVKIILINKKPEKEAQGLLPPPRDIPRKIIFGSQEGGKDPLAWVSIHDTFFK
jgi:hypothetical protein